MLDLVIKQNINSVDDSITIYPFKNVTKLEFQENVLKLALKSTQQQTSKDKSEDSNFLFVSSVHVDNDYNCLSLIIEQFDQGQTKFSNNGTKTGSALVPTVSLPDSIYIPSRFVNQTSLTLESNQTDDNVDNMINYYFNAVKFLTSYFLKFCSNIETLSKILSMSSTIHFNNSQVSNNINNNSNTILNATFDLITLANCFDAQRIQPIPIIETSLLKTLQTTANFYLKPKTGYCALYKDENIVLIMDSEPKANKLSFMGIWISGTQNVNHPLTWAACIRYAFSNLIANKSNEFTNSFVVILFPSISRRPEYYLCKPLQSKLEFTLFNGFNKLLVNKLSNENRCISVDLNEIKDGYRYKLFSNSVSQVFRQELYGHHQLLQHQSNHQQQVKAQQSENFSLLSISSPIQNSDDPELQPRSLSASILTSNSNTVCNQLSLQPPQPQPYKISNTISLSPRDTVLVKPTTISNSNLNINTNSNIIVGSYHSVSDISVLSDNENDDSCSAYFLNNNRNGNKAKNKLLSHSDDFEFLRPKDPLALPQISSQSSGHICVSQQAIYQNLASSSMSQLEKMKYNQNLYSSNNSLSSSLSSSYSPLPSTNNSLSNSNNPPPFSSSSSSSKSQSNLKSNILLNKNSISYENSKSMLFGIPRDSPMPTIASMASADFHPMNLDSPFVDITLNNCEDMSMYQPKSNIKNESQLQQQYSPLSHANQQLKPIITTPQLSQACASSASASASSSYSFQQNPAYLNSSMLSSSTSTSSSSNNSHHSLSSSTNSCPYTCQQSILNSQSTNSSSSTNLNNLYQFNQYNSHQTHQKHFNNNQEQNNMHQHQQQQFQDQYELYFNKDEQLADQMYRMQQLQEKMSSLNFLNKNSQTNTDIYNQNTNMQLATSNAISLLSNQIEERKNFLKANFHNSNHKSSQNQQQMLHQQNPMLQNQLNSNQKTNSCQIQSNKINQIIYQSEANTKKPNQDQEQQQQQQQVNHQSYQNRVIHPNNFEISRNSTNSPPTYKEDLFSLSTNSLKSLNQHQHQQQQNHQVASNSLNDLSRPQTFNYQMQQQHVNSMCNKNESSSSNNSQSSLNSSHKSDYLTQKLQQVQSNPQQNNKQFTNLVPVSSLEFQHQLRMSKEFEETSQMKKINENEKKKIEESEDDDDDDDDDDEIDGEEDDNDKSEFENVFGTALKDLKQNRNWHQSIVLNSNQSTFIESTKNQEQNNKTSEPDANSVSVYLNDTSQLPKFNYVSLLLDEYCDKNTSINTEALAFKYLKNSNSNSSSQMTTYNYESFSANNASSFYPSVSMSQNTIIEPATSVNQFKFYQNSFHLANDVPSSSTNVFNSNKITTDPNNQRLNLNHNKNADLLPSQILGSKPADNYASEKNENKADSEESNSNEESSDDDGEVWLFGKPKNGPATKNKFLDKTDSRPSITNKIPPLALQQKQRKKLQSQKKRNSTGTNKIEKDFSDQDEVDRDVTTVLDIEKLKRLPKLL